ncbi:sugar porter family MFS transporter [Tamlana sp. 2_MG-2023]|uniref:sugar porter family MFS transporter n=1 Tax=unclassified Tamlana TaxID=2614803 RepID=UPI0026E14E01|nr:MULTISPECIES: sugar porter family MFS transporter [unclassified Tamlana]MDO6761219.1 sugar porter family MFS transporter [Tamlana sp. 2_MG-2023]MDO6791702.1 sugar porter family MFS transporter [Tamlana sp. 1_MG-2023]
MRSYKKNAYIYSTIVAIGGFVFGLDAALISGTVKFISQEFALNEIQLGMVVGAPALGVLLALFFAGYACNKYGRRKTLQIVALLYVVSAVGSSLSPNYWSLLSFRFLGGLAFTSISLAAMYIGEIAPPKLRGKLVTMIQINIVIGLSGAYFINYLILQLGSSDAAWVRGLGINEHTWRWMLGSEILPALLWLILLFFVPRSPAWLFYNDKADEARQTLRKLLPEDKVSEHMEEMKISMDSSSGDKSVLSQLSEIFSKPLRVTFIIAMTLAIAQQTSGINAILFYAPTVFEQIGIGTDAAFIQAIWTGLTALVFTFLGLLLIDRLGRRPMIIGGMAWIVVSLGIAFYGFNTATYTLTEEAISEMTEIQNTDRLSNMIDIQYDSDIALKNALIKSLGEEDTREHSSLLIQKSADINAVLVLIGILSFIAAFHFSIGPVMWVLFSEIFPISIRGIAIPFFTLITSTVSWLIQMLFPTQLATFGISNTLLFYAATVFIGMVILYKYLIETKNLTIEEIQLKLEKK